MYAIISTAQLNRSGIYIRMWISNYISKEIIVVIVAVVLSHNTPWPELVLTKVSAIYGITKLRYVM